MNVASRAAASVSRRMFSRVVSAWSLARYGSMHDPMMVEKSEEVGPAGAADLEEEAAMDAADDALDAAVDESAMGAAAADFAMDAAVDEPAMDAAVDELALDAAAEESEDVDDVDCRSGGGAVDDDDADEAERGFRRRCLEESRMAEASEVVDSGGSTEGRLRQEVTLDTS